MTERELWGKSFKMRSSDLRHCHSFIPFKVEGEKSNETVQFLKGHVSFFQLHRVHFGYDYLMSSRLKKCVIGLFPFHPTALTLYTTSLKAIISYR